MPYANPETRRSYQRAWVASRRAQFFATKLCSWCGSTEDLELHHLDPSKKVAHAIWSWSERRRAAEIAKCVVVCGPCHDSAHREAQKVEAQLKHSHGTIRSYWRGCRCAPCKTARRDYARGVAA